MRNHFLGVAFFERHGLCWLRLRRFDPYITKAEGPFLKLRYIGHCNEERDLVDRITIRPAVRAG